MFNWLGTFWRPDAIKGKGSDLSFLGSGINVGPNQILAQRKAVEDINKISIDEAQGSLFSQRSRAQYISPTTPVIHNEEGSQPGGDNKKRYFSLKDVGSPNGWFVVLRRYNRDNFGFSDFKEFPTLEGNTSEFGTDCFYYGWSIRPEGDVKNSEHLRYFVKMPVERLHVPKCENHVCYFQQKNAWNAGGCHNIREAGTPILCGKEKKLTYIVIYDWLDISRHSVPDECAVWMKAVHVPHMKSELERIVKHDIESMAMEDRKKKDHWG